MNKKKLLTMDDLYSFYSNHKRSVKFDSQKSGYQLSVHVPATFENVEESELVEDGTLFFCPIRMFHVGRNRNCSNVTREAAEKAMKGLAYKPLLANFCEYTDEETGETIRDFTSHDMYLDMDEEKIVYIEKQIGCVTTDPAYIAHDDTYDKDYVYARVAIPTEYTDAVDIIKRKNGTKVSVELLINEMSYDAKEKELLLTDVVVQGVTCLGVDPETHDAVEEGMEGSRLSLKDFSTKNNSIFSCVDKDTALIETLEKLTEVLSNFNINVAEKSVEDNYRKEANIKMAEVNIDETIVTENLDDATENGVTDTTFEDTADEVIEEGEVTEEEVPAEETEPETDETDADPEVTDEADPEVEPETTEEDPEVADEAEVETEACGDKDKEDEACEPKDEKKEKCSITYELSHDSIRYALYELLERDDVWTWIMDVFDEYVIYEECDKDYSTCHIFKHAYKKVDDVVSLDGEPIEVFHQFLTKEEVDALEEMRANYETIKEELNAYKEEEEYSEKLDEVFSDEDYANYLDTEEFKALMSRETVLKYSKEELTEKADAVLGRLIRKSGTFAKTTDNKANVLAFAQRTQNVSFLDGLLNKNKNK